MNKWYLTLSILIISTNLVGCATRQQTGTLVGGVAGGLIGSQIGGGSGRVLATGVGAVAGGLIGGEIGRSEDMRASGYEEYYEEY